MSEDQLSYEPIGVIRTAFESAEGMPIQPVGDTAGEGTVELKEKYRAGLQDLDGFMHCILLYHFHASDDAAPLKVDTVVQKYLPV